MVIRDDDTLRSDHREDHTLKTMAIVFGIVFLIIGALGFVPQAMVDGNLFGLFRVNTVHNIIHLASGAVALLCGLNSECASRLYFQIFGVIYGLIAVLGLYYQNEDMFNGILAHNIHDIWLHALIAAVSLYLGFFYRHKDGTHHDRCDRV